MRRVALSLVTMFLALFALAGIFTALGSTPVSADPAANVVKTFTQPDGTTIDLHLWGNEVVHGWETSDGYTVLQNAASYWEYATADTTGALIPSGIVVGKGTPPTAPGLRPSGEALATAQERFTLPQFGNVHAEGLPGTRPAWATGNMNFLVIMVQFPDEGRPGHPAVPCTFTANDMLANLFSTGPAYDSVGNTSTTGHIRSSGPGDLQQYYRQVSFNNLNLVGTVVGCYTVAHDRDWYNENASRDVTLVQEAVALADADISFAPFDNDGDGKVDNVAIAYAGCGPDNGCYSYSFDTLWPHMNTIGAISVDGGARTVNQFYMVPELLGVGVIRTIGVFAHEFGHSMGLPDLYLGGNGVGHWSLMGSGSWTSNNPGSENGESPSLLDAWGKWVLGWLSPTNLTGLDQQQAIPQADSNAFAVQLLNNPSGPLDWNSSGSGSGEYFLVENRERTGTDGNGVGTFDRGLDGCGLLAWHIDESRGGNGSTGHTAGSHQLVDLEEANGTQDLDLGGANRGDAGDPFPGSTNNTRFNDTTNPYARLYDGTNSGVQMQLISTGCASTMTAFFGQDVTPPTTSLSVGTPKFISGGTTYVGSATVHTLSANDGAGSGVKTTFYRYYPTGGPAPAYSTGTSFSISGADGTYTIEYYSVDNLDNAEAPHSVQETLDNTPPTTTLALGSPKFTDGSGHIWVMGSTPHTLSASDGTGSGVSATYWRFYLTSLGAPVGGWTAGTSFTLGSAADGQYTVEWYSVDNVNNTETINSQQEYIDNTPPVSSVSTLLFYQTSSPSFPVAYDATDAGSGVNHVELWYRYRAHSAVPWGAWTQYGAGFTASPIAFTPPSGLGLYEFYTVGVDNVGNTESAPASADAATRFVPVVAGQGTFFYGSAGDLTPDNAVRGGKVGFWMNWVTKSFQFFTPATAYPPRFNVGGLAMMQIPGPTGTRQIRLMYVDSIMRVSSSYIETSIDGARLEYLDRPTITSYNLYDPNGIEVPY